MWGGRFVEPLVNKNYRLLRRQTKPNQAILDRMGAQPGLSKAAAPQTKRTWTLWLRKQKRRKRRKRPKRKRKSKPLARAAIPPEQFSRRIF